LAPIRIIKTMLVNRVVVVETCFRISRLNRLFQTASATAPIHPTDAAWWEPPEAPCTTVAPTMPVEAPRSAPTTTVLMASPPLMRRNTGLFLDKTQSWYLQCTA